MLDAIMSPEWESRYFSFDPRWNVRSSERMGSMRNGSGDQYFIVFGPNGTFIKGFAHEAPMSPWCQERRSIWPGVVDMVPTQFAAQVEEPAFSPEETTFCIWRLTQDTSWRCGRITYPEGRDPDGSVDLLWMLDGLPRTYADFARNYFEREVGIGDVRSIYGFEPLTEQMVVNLNSDCAWPHADSAAREIGYPVARR
jgi:hypothetical protein